RRTEDGVDSGRRARGTLEQEVVAALAAAHEPMTPAQVRDHLGRDLAYTTVMTVLARLSDKGLVTRERVGRAYAYRAVRDEAEFPAVSRYGDWSAEQVREGSPFPTVIAVGCCMLAVLALGRAAITGTRRVRILLAVRQSCRHVGEPGSLVVLDNDRPDAFATPGAHGRIVVTTGL